MSEELLKAYIIETIQDVPTEGKEFDELLEEVNKYAIEFAIQIAPKARPDDGLLDMVVFGNMRKSDLLKMWPTTYKGRHVSHNKVRMRKISNVSISSSDKILLEADGEFLGEGPVSFSVLPSALNIVI